MLRSELRQEVILAECLCRSDIQLELMLTRVAEIQSALDAPDVHFCLSLP